MSDTLAPSVTATRWRPWRHRQRPCLYLNATTGEGVTNSGASFTCPPRLLLSVLAECLPAEMETVYLCGPLPAAPQVATEDGELYSAFNSWIVAAQPEHMYLSSGADHAETLAVIRRTDGREVDVHTVASWLSTNDCTPREVYEALALVTEQLRHQHGWQDVCLLKTPALTGLELWRSSIGPSRESGRWQSTAYPLLPEALRRLIHRMSGQGRFELLPPSTPDGMAPSLVYLDGRLAYAAPALGELGVGPATHDHQPVYAGFTPARYRVGFRVPDEWAHVGLLPVQRAEGTGLIFPRTPGWAGETWVDAAEVRIAFAPYPHTCPDCAARYATNDGRRCPLHGWPMAIRERIVFTKGRPLRTWTEKLVAVREACGGNALARAAVRNILLHAIGAFHGTHRPITRLAPWADVPNHIPTRLVMSPAGNELHLWEEPGIAPRFPDYDRPEWSSQVWARTRARLLLHRTNDGTFTGALTLPYEQVVAFRLDALYTTADPGWPDNGRPGVLRLKGRLPGPVLWPREETDLAAVKESRGEP